MSYLVYMITSGTLYYVGMTNNFIRRIQQHNGHLKGGAKFTKRSQEWSPVLIIDGFPTKSEAMKCEWALKTHRGNNFRGIMGRFQRLDQLLVKNQWTSTSDNISDQTLTLYVTEKYKDKVTVPTKELEW